MKLNEYLARRDQFIQASLYLKVSRQLLAQGFSDEQADELIREAFTKSVSDWAFLVDTELAEPLGSIEVPLHSDGGM